MADVLVRGLDPSTVASLKDLASKNSRSLQQELRAIIEKAAAENDYWKRRRLAYEAALRIQADLRATGRAFGDSTEIIREDRDVRSSAVAEGAQHTVRGVHQSARPSRMSVAPSE